MGLLSAVGSAAGLGPVLVRTSVGGSWHATRATASWSSRAARGAVAAAVAAPAGLVRAAAALVDAGPARRVWTSAGRAHVEVWGLDGASAPVLVGAVQDALCDRDGVSWARVDAVTRRAVVRFEPERVEVADLVALVAGAEQALDIQAPGYRPDEPAFPGDLQPVHAQAWALAADVAGLSAAVAGRLTALPSLPGSAAAAVVLVDNQPRLRRLLEARLGPAPTDLALAVSTAAVQGLTQGASSLLLDTAQRTQALLAARALREAFSARERELAGRDRPVPDDRCPQPGPRPVPLPAGPVERYADRAAAGSLLVAGGLLAATGSLDLAGRALLIGAPKAARAGREAFADTLAWGLSRRGLVVLDPAALRRTDRVDTVLVDSRVLHDQRPLVLSATASADRWTVEHVWSAAQRLLACDISLPVPPPLGRSRERLALLEQAAPHEVTGLSLRVLTEDGVPVGQVLVGTELDPYADAVLTAARGAGLRLLLTRDPAAPELAGQADEVLPDDGALVEHVRRLQAGGSVVALVSAVEDALTAADLAIGVVPAVGRVPWGGDLLCGPGLLEVPRLLAAVPAAHGRQRRRGDRCRRRHLPGSSAHCGRRPRPGREGGAAGDRSRRRRVAVRHVRCPAGAPAARTPSGVAHPVARPGTRRGARSTGARRAAGRRRRVRRGGAPAPERAGAARVGAGPGVGAAA